MSKKTIPAKKSTLARRLAAYVLTTTALLLVALGLYGCDGNSPTSPTPAPSPTTVTSVALPTDVISDSPPSASWEELLAVARAKVAPVYTDAIISAVSASPYDYSLNAYYQPKSDILRVGFSFITPAATIIKVEMADDSPATTTQISVDEYNKDNAFSELSLEIYSNTVKVEPTIAKALTLIKVTPRQAIQRTQKEAIDHAYQVGLGNKTLVPDVKLNSLNESGPQWEVKYALNAINENGQLDLRDPVATFKISAQTGEVTSRIYQDAKSALAATPGITATGQALVTVLMPTVSALETQGPPTTAQQYYEQGKMAESSRQEDQALADYNQAITLDPNFADAYMARALIYEAGYDYEKVIADCTKVINIKPRYEAYIKRGSAYVHIGDADPAKRQTALALQDFNAAIQLEPEKAEPYAFRGLAYYDQNDYDAAIIAYTEAIRYDANYREAYFARGLSYQAKQEYDLAIGDYDQYIKLDPHKSWAFRQRADAYAYKHNPTQAILDYTEAIRLQPDYRDAYFSRGHAYEDLFDYDHALQDFNKVVELDPKFPFGYEGRGNVYYQTGHNAQAISEFDAGLNIAPSNGQIYEERGRAYLRSGKLQQSMDDFNKAIELVPEGALNYMSRGRAYMSIDDYDSAIADFNKALQNNANYTWAYDNRAIAYAYKGDFTTAFANIDQAIKIGGEDGHSYFARGKVYALHGEKDKAIADFNKCAQLAKDYGTQQDITKELQALQGK